MAREKQAIERPGTLLYKCRRCGEVYSVNVHTPNAFTSLIDISLGKTGGFLYPTTFHECADGKVLGMADFAGVEYDAE